VSRQRASKIVDEPGFPAPVAEDGRGRLWNRRDVAVRAKLLANREAVAVDSGVTFGPWTKISGGRRSWNSSIPFPRNSRISSSAAIRERSSLIQQRLNASQRDLDDFRFGNPRLFAQLRDALEHHVEGSELDRYREEWEQRAQVCYTWVRRLLAAHEINRESTNTGSVDTVDLEQLERVLRERLDALGPAPRAELLHVLMLPDFDRADRIGEFYKNPKTRTFADLLIDCEEDRTLRAVLVGMLREAGREPR
jgi:hypothetical protein